MASCNLWLIIAVCLILTFLSQTARARAEIHRTRTTRGGKAVPYPGGDSDVGASFEGEFDSREEGDAAADEYDRNEAWICALLATILVGLTGIFPLFLPIEANSESNDNSGAAKFNCILSFAVGGLLGDVFLHLLPEAWAHIKPDDFSGQRMVGVWVIVGLLTFLFLEKVFGDGDGDDDGDKEDHVSKSQNTMMIVQNGKQKSSHAHENNVSNGHTTLHQSTSNGVSKRRVVNGSQRGSSKGKKSDSNKHTQQISRKQIHRNGSVGSIQETDAQTTPKKVKVVGYLNLLANFIDNFTHGIAVAGSFLVSRKVGLLTTAAIMLHEVPHEVGDFAILLRSGFTRWQAAKAQMSTALGGLCGALVTLLSESAQIAGDRAAWVLPFTAGGFLHIALVTVLPDLHKESSRRESVKQVVGLLAGIAVMAAVTLVVE